MTMDAHLDSLADVCRGRMEKLASMEGSDTYTMNDHYFTDSKAAFLAKLKKANLGVLNKAVAVRGVRLPDKNVEFVVDSARYFPIHVQDAEFPKISAHLLNYLQLAGISFKTLDEVQLAQTTSEDDELNMMAATLAYCKVAMGSRVPRGLNNFSALTHTRLYARTPCPAGGVQAH